MIKALLLFSILMVLSVPTQAQTVPIEPQSKACLFYEDLHTNILAENDGDVSKVHSERTKRGVSILVSAYNEAVPPSAIEADELHVYHKRGPFNLLVVFVSKGCVVLLSGITQTQFEMFLIQLGEPA